MPTPAAAPAGDGAAHAAGTQRKKRARVRRARSGVSRDQWGEFRGTLVRSLEFTCERLEHASERMICPAYSGTK